MRASALLGVWALALAGCGGGGATTPTPTSPTPVVTPPPVQGLNPSACASKAVATQEIYVAYADHIDVYPLTASGSDCPVRTIRVAVPAQTTVQGIAIGGGRLFAFLKPPPSPRTTQILVYDAATGTPQPENTITADVDGEGSIAYASGVPAVYVASYDIFYGPHINSYAPTPALRNGDPRQNKNYVGGNRSTLAVTPDGTVYTGLESGVQVYAADAANIGNPGDPIYQTPRPIRTFGPVGGTEAALALASDDTAYVGYHAYLDPNNSAIAVYPPNATSSTAPLRILQITDIRSIAVDASGDLIVLHNARMDTYAPGGGTLIRTVTATPTTAGPSALALGP
ncbi:MAG: hypothetical protein M3169_18745 [Candidatus Eremiobacteraeota bacterium]|nr:hypothetical protein [Candidatus Eremiobacteraeota bacterium]